MRKAGQLLAKEIIASIFEKLLPTGKIIAGIRKIVIH